jgi:uncharacterized protein (DUF433 family)
MVTRETALIDEYIEPNPHRPGLDEARLRQYGVSVWAIVGYWKGFHEDADRVAKAFAIPREAVDAAIAYYLRHRLLIDARIDANSSAFL